MRLRLSITVKLTLVFVMFAALLLVGVGSLAYNSGRAALEAATISDLLSVAIEKEAALNVWVENRQSDIIRLTHLPDLLEDVVAFVARPDQITHDRLVRTLQTWTGSRQQYLALLVIDAETGRVIAATDPDEEGKFKENRPYFIHGKNGPYVQNVYYSLVLQGPAMTAAAPLYSAEGRLVGVLAGRLNLMEMNQIINRRTGLHQTDDAFLVNTSNLFVTQPRAISDPAILRRGIHTEAVRRCLAHQSGVIPTENQHGTPEIVVYRWLSERQLCLIVKLDQAEALAPSYTFGRTILLIGSLTLLVASLLAIGLARTITQPVLALQAGAVRFGQGELDVRLPETSGDELGGLAREFNSMAAALSEKEAQLRRYTEKLAQIVEERTVALRESETTFRLLFANHPHPMWVYDLQTLQFLEVNEAAINHYGYSRDEFCQMFITDIRPPEDVPLLFDHLQGERPALQQSGRWRHRLKDGRIIDVEITSHLLEFVGRKAALVVALDITERKRAEEALQASQARLAGIIGSTMDAIITVDAEQRIVLFNAAAEQMFRCSASEVVGQPLDRFIPPQFRDLHRQHIQFFARTKVSNRSMGALGAITGLRADGQEFPIEASISQVEAAGQRLYTVILRDITERKRAEEQIQRQTARAKALMNIAARLNAQLNLETVLTTICEETAHALKVPATAVRLYDPKQDVLYYANAFGLPSNYKEYTQPSPGSLYRELIQQYGKLIIANDVQNIPGVPNAKLYACLNIRMVVTALMFREGQLVGALNLFIFDQARHFTEDELSLLTGLADQAAQAITNARLYAQLEAANQELAYSNTELQQFAYVASHDLQEPLRMVASYTQLLARRYRGKLDSDADEFIAYAVDGANRMQRLINDLLAYSRLGTRGKSLELTSSESALAQALANLQIAIAENEAVVSHDPLPTVWADETQLVQLFQNLVGNAIKFRSLLPPRIHISAQQKEQGWLFSVSDNGIGIEPQYAERIFVIFQRLHSQAEYSGTGIGLAVCKRIVERHGGRIWMESQPGQGATFYFTLPATGREI